MNKRINRIIYIIVITILLIFIGICSYFTYYFYDLHKEDMGLVELKYNEKGSIGYNVLLTDGKYYNGSSKKSSYIVELMDSVNAYFNYNITFNSTIKGEYSYKVKGHLYTNDTNINQNISTIELTDTDNHVYQVEGNVINLSKEFNINVIDALNKYKELTKTSTNKLSSVIIYDVIIKYQVYSEEIDKYVEDTVTLSINVPINSYSSDIATTNDFDNTEYKFSDFEVGKDEIYPMICLEFCGAIVLFIILIIQLLIKIDGTISTYDKELDYILGKYHNIIINSNLVDLANKDVIFTKDIDSLAKVAEKLNQNINYTEIMKDNEAVFIVLNRHEAYIYKLTTNK